MLEPGFVVTLHFLGNKLRHVCFVISSSFMRDKIFKNGQSKICGRQPLNNLERYGLLKHTISHQIF